VGFPEKKRDYKKRNAPQKKKSTKEASLYIEKTEHQKMEVKGKVDHTRERPNLITL